MSISTNPTNTIGVLGGRWRATVSGWGSVRPWDGSADLDWYIAADDRWHIPAAETTLRQRRLDAAPVIETRIKVPGGDAVQRVWCVADGGGLTVVELENDSSLPFAVAFSRADLLASRAATNVAAVGIDLPPGSVVFPVGHRSTVRFGLAHVATGPSTLPAQLSSAHQVASGWAAVLDRAGRLVLPDDALSEEIARLRSELVLGGPVHLDDDAAGLLIDVGQLVRLGEPARAWVADVAEAVSRVGRAAQGWESAAALDGAAIVLDRAGETRAARDLARIRSGAPPPLPRMAPSDHLLAWHEQRLARPAGAGVAEILGSGLPTGWRGSDFEVHGLPVGPSTSLSYALRWHGNRPAVLWETDGPALTLTAAALAPGWSTGAGRGEALWPEVTEGGDGTATPLTGVSFS